VIQITIEVSHSAIQEGLKDAVAELAYADSTLQVVYAANGSVIVRAPSQEQLGAVVDALRGEPGLDIVIGRVSAVYHEVIRTSAHARVPFERAIPTGRLFGDVELSLEPMGGDSGVEFEWRVAGSRVPGDYAAAVEAGVREAVEEGPVMGYPMTDIRVIAIDGSYRPGESNSVAFKIAANQTMKAAAKAAELRVIEPIMAVEINTTRRDLAAVLEDLLKRRSSAERVAPWGKDYVIRARVPMAELIDYATNLAARTEERARCILHYSHYADIGQSSFRRTQPASSEPAEHATFDAETPGGGGARPRIKEVRLRPSVAEDYLQGRATCARRFLEQGYTVELHLLFQGSPDRPTAEAVIRRIIGLVSDIATAEGPQWSGDRSVVAILSPKRYG
jgi:translation elongation factor EF-G